MGWLRMRTNIRYGHIFRVGIFNYVLFILLLIAICTSVHNLTLRHLDKVSGAPSTAAHHVHRRVQDITPRSNDNLAAKATRSPRKRVPVYAHMVYPSNLSRPVRIVPPVAAEPAPRIKELSVPCSVVRVVDFFGQPLTLEGDPLCEWLTKPTPMADGHFILYGDSQMALLYDVILDSTYRIKEGARGGERMDEVWGQDENSEYLKLKEGFFTLQCSAKPTAKFESKDYLNEWMQAVRCSSSSSSTGNSSGAGEGSLVKGLTIAVQRYEYVNLYHTMTDWYNAFLIMLMFDQNPDHVTVLWVDAHPQGGLDDTWVTLFGEVLRAGTLPNPTHFSALAWAAMGYNSPLNQHSRPSVDYLEDFRHFFLSRHGVRGGRTANCSSLSWMFIWRRDYAAHPRNKGGHIKRKIDNEEELLKAMKEVLGPEDKVHGLQLDALPMKTQLQLISETDVLLGMHGAGLSHTLFLPPHGGLLEFYPTYWPQANRHFRAMAAWRGLHYQTWQNNDVSNERDNYRTYIPPQVVVRMVKEMRRNICG